MDQGIFRIRVQNDLVFPGMEASLPIKKYKLDCRALTAFGQGGEREEKESRCITQFKIKCDSTVGK